jgi:hypothetical protein
MDKRKSGCLGQFALYLPCKTLGFRVVIPIQVWGGNNAPPEETCRG